MKGRLENKVAIITGAASGIGAAAVEKFLAEGAQVLAGGGLKHRGAYGVTDELSKKIVENPVSVSDFHATIHAALGIHPHKELFDGSRPVPITDFGKPVAALFG